MKNIYNDFREGRPTKGLARVSAILILVMVWILIDKGNACGQSQSDQLKSLDKEMGLTSSDPLFKSGNRGGDDEVIGEDPDSDDDNNFDIYPNPFEKDLVFDFEFTVKGEQGAPFEVVDAQGRLVDQGVLAPGSSQYKIDLGGLPHGMYFVRIDVGSTPQVKRVIKK